MKDTIRNILLTLLAVIIVVGGTYTAIQWDAIVGTSPKKYGMSLHKRQNQVATHYNYIPRVPRNQPYQRRAY